MEDIEKDTKPRFIEDLGMRFMTEASRQKYRYGLFECQYCGEEFECVTHNIKRGHTKSCGCQKGGITHGLHNNKFYKTWKGMLYRCTNLKHKSYPNYGARGITVCDEWLDVTNFVAWCDLTHPNIEGVSLDRIDNDLGYSPENCRWVDRTAQAINQRMREDNTSGYVGIYWNKDNKKWVVNISVNNKLIYIGSFKDKIEAVLARDNYIIENNLPHKLSTEYIKDKR